MAFSFSNHAIEKMIERNISKEEAEKVLAEPMEVVHEDENTVYQGLIAENQKRYLIRIFVNERVEPKKVITIYKTSKISKYHEGEIR